MKKYLAIILAFCMLIGLCATGHAEDVTQPDIQITGNFHRYAQQYILDEYVGIYAEMTDEYAFEKFDRIIVDLTCNKDVVVDNGPFYEVAFFRCSETETGYRYEMLELEPFSKRPNIYMSLKVIAKGTPDVKFSAVGITKDGKEQELMLSVDMPNNKVYEKDEIPHIVTDLQPPVFGNGVSFGVFGEIFVYAPQTVNQIKNMLSSSDGKSKIVYLPCDSAERENIVNGDVFALEFEGKLCDFIYVYVMGDANSDGLVTSGDARLVLRHSAMLVDENANISLKSCDVNHDGEISAVDARIILRVSAQIDYFRLPDITVWQNQKYKIGPLMSLSDAGYLWRCTVSEEGAIEVTETIEPSVDNTGKEPDEIIVGASALQTFMLKPLEQGVFEVHFELIRSWEKEPIKEFGFTIVVDDVLN